MVSMKWQWVLQFYGFPILARKIIIGNTLVPEAT